MEKRILGLHHVTAIASDPQRNVDFYVGVLGLRLVKRTVNFDDPGTYHLYYGDDIGHPGTIMTFFPWPGAPRGQRGIGQTTVTAFAIPAGSLGFWSDRLRGLGLEVEGPTRRFDEEVLLVSDPDDLHIELVAEERADERPGWTRGPVPAQHAIRGFHGVTLTEEGFERTAALLTETLGFRMARDDGSRFRYEAGCPGGLVDVVCAPGAPYGEMGAGIVHHIAWRAADDEQQIGWRLDLAQQGYNVTPVMDRQYFHSIYFREPGGVLFEIATDPPGFTRDESPEDLGTHLKLPPWLERYRDRIEAALPTINPPDVR